MIDLIEGKIELTQFNKNPRINGKNKLADNTEVILNLDELDNSNTSERVT